MIYECEICDYKRDCTIKERNTNPRKCLFMKKQPGANEKNILVRSFFMYNPVLKMVVHIDMPDIPYKWRIFPINDTGKE